MDWWAWKHMLKIIDACYESWSTRKWIGVARKWLQWMLGGGEHASEEIIARGKQDQQQAEKWRGHP
uniref:Uncharacterized protein n=1 Tax=Oryza punctata TaxID=4537 RepID=A0A0E0LRL6_ORYPU